MTVNNNEWINSEKIDLSKHIGFIYRITNLINGKQYIGKKQLSSTLTKKLTKKELLELPIKRGKRPVKKKVTKESNWKSYWGSCKPLIEDIKELGEDNFKREILFACSDKQALSYLEIRLQMEERVLENVEKYYNYNISGKFFPSKVVNYENFV